MKLEDLTTKALSGFIGGQLEIQNRSEEYLYRGEIARAYIEGDNLKVRFAWQAKMEGGEWHIAEGLDYVLTLWFDREKNQPLCAVQRLSDGRLMIRGASVFVAEVLTFFPPNGDKLDPAKVRGLVPAS